MGDAIQGVALIVTGMARGGRCSLPTSTSAATGRSERWGCGVLLGGRGRWGVGGGGGRKVDVVLVKFDNSEGDVRGSGGKNVIFSNGLNSMSECSKLLY